MPLTGKPASVSRGRRNIQFLCDFYLPEVHAGVLDYARSAGWALSDFKCFAQNRLFDESEQFHGFLATVTDAKLSDWLKRQSRPMVRLLCSEQDLPCPSVEPDSLAIGTMGAEHLLGLGAPTFAFYRGIPAGETDRMWTGFSERLKAAGRAAHFIDFGQANLPDPGTTSRRIRWDWLRDQIAALLRPLALLVEDDRFVNDVFEAADMLGLRIPDDVAVLGIDNREIVLRKYPLPVSSVDSNLQGIGWAGAALLDRMLNGEEVPAEPVLIKPKEVVARQSTATFVCDHVGVGKAVNFLRGHYANPLRIEEIAQAAGVSTRTLQASFKQYLGCTISEQLSRLRLAHAVRLLRESDLKLESVAYESGLRNAKYLCEMFRPVFGVTPTEFREMERASSAAE